MKRIVYVKRKKKKYLGGRERLILCVLHVSLSIFLVVSLGFFSESAFHFEKQRDRQTDRQEHLIMPWLILKSYQVAGCNELNGGNQGLDWWWRRWSVWTLIRFDYVLIILAMDDGDLVARLTIFADLKVAAVEIEWNWSIRPTLLPAKGQGCNFECSSTFHVPRLGFESNRETALNCLRSNLNVCAICNRVLRGLEIELIHEVQHAQIQPVESKVESSHGSRARRWFRLSRVETHGNYSV